MNNLKNLYNKLIDKKNSVILFFKNKILIPVIHIVSICITYINKIDMYNTLVRVITANYMSYFKYYFEKVELYISKSIDYFIWYVMNFVYDNLWVPVLRFFYRRIDFRILLMFKTMFGIVLLLIYYFYRSFILLVISIYDSLIAYNKQLHLFFINNYKANLKLYYLWGSIIFFLYITYYWVGHLNMCEDVIIGYYTILPLRFYNIYIYI